MWVALRGLARPGRGDPFVLTQKSRHRFFVHHLSFFSEIFICLTRDFLLIGISAAAWGTILEVNALQAAIILSIAQRHMFDGLLRLGSGCHGR